MADLEAMHASPYFIAEVRAHRGEIDETLKWLGRAFERRDFGIAFLKIDFPALDGEPRYQALLRKMHLT
jgi:hypothetical protein